MKRRDLEDVVKSDRVVVHLPLRVTKAAAVSTRWEVRTLRGCYRHRGHNQTFRRVDLKVMATIQNWTETLRTNFAGRIILGIRKVLRRILDFLGLLQPMDYH